MQNIMKHFTSQLSAGLLLDTSNEKTAGERLAVSLIFGMS